MSSPTKPVEQKARELLAAQYERDVERHEARGHQYAALTQRRKAQDIRDGKAELHAIAAIIAALNTDGERIRREAVCAVCKGARDDLADGRDPEELCDPCYEDAKRSLSTPSKGVG